MLARQAIRTASGDAPVAPLLLAAAAPCRPAMCGPAALRRALPRTRTRARPPAHAQAPGRHAPRGSGAPGRASRRRAPFILRGGGPVSAGGHAGGEGAGNGRARRHARHWPAAGGGPCAPWAAGMRRGEPGGARAGGDVEARRGSTRAPAGRPAARHLMVRAWAAGRHLGDRKRGRCPAGAA